VLNLSGAFLYSQWGRHYKIGPMPNFELGQHTINMKWRWMNGSWLGTAKNTGF